MLGPDGHRFADPRVHLEKNDRVVFPAVRVQRVKIHQLIRIIGLLAVPSSVRRGEQDDLFPGKLRIGPIQLSAHPLLVVRINVCIHSGHPRRDDLLVQNTELLRKEMADVRGAGNGICILPMAAVRPRTAQMTPPAVPYALKACAGMPDLDHPVVGIQP